MGKEQSSNKKIIQSLPLSAVAILGAMFILIGFMFAKVLSLEKMVNNHYSKLVSDVNELERIACSLEVDFKDIKKELKDLNNAINSHFKGMREDIRTDVREVIRTEMKALRPRDPNS